MPPAEHIRTSSEPSYHLTDNLYAPRVQFMRETSGSPVVTGPYYNRSGVASGC